ncbi:hypothetical protein SAMN05216349_10638 [Oribacterium sp. KHPX15]|nr:hypothetical protein SAMN05216349_10638 [Oribacterium sp. KHPX15]
MIAELISAILENFIYDITSSGIKSWFDKRRQKKFLKNLRKEIDEFCSRNESIYIDSSAFEYFLRNKRFIEKVIERAIATKLENSNKEFLKIEIKKARDIAKAEEIGFSNDEERIIKDLFHIIDERVGSYYREKLSVEQRHMVSVCLDKLSLLQESVNIGLKNDQKILEAINSNKNLTDAEAVIIADLLSKGLREGRFEEFDNLAMVVKGKSNDLAIFQDCLTQIIQADNCADAIKRLADVHNAQVRDNAIRIALPVLLFRREKIEGLSNLASAGALRELASCLEKNEINGILSETVTIDSGLEIHNFEVNKKLAFEEEWLTKQIAVQVLHGKKIRNIYSAMEEIEKNNNSWLTEVLIADRKIEKYIDEVESEDGNARLEAILNSLLQKRDIYDRMGRDIRAFYYSVIAKIHLILGRCDEAEKLLPEDLLVYTPLSDYVIAIKNEKQEIDINEIYEYAVKNDTYWLINNYFVAKKNENELILFCRKHEEVLDKDISLFFMYISALSIANLNEEKEKQLKKYSNRLQHTYEYWTEIFTIDASEDMKQLFIEACRDGKMSGLFAGSEYRIIERLLHFGEYDIAEIYLRKHEKCGENNFRIKKYNAIIQQGKKNDVEAIKWFKASFAENPRDIYVIDSLITLSLMNKRNIDKTVIDAAINADTSRLHMLVAVWYLSEGDVTKAKNENIRSILMSEEGYNPAFGQFLSIKTRSDNNDVIRISGIEGGTAAYCKDSNGLSRWLCIYKDNILPSSPHIWNGDYHIHVEDAAGMGFLRKHKGDHIDIEGVDYEVLDIIPIDAYLFRTCTSKMTQTGFAKEISIPSKNGKMDISAFNDWIINNTPDERETYNWLDQYNNIQDVPMPLFAYKRFTRLTYVQFVDQILMSQGIFVRELFQQSQQAKKYVISFSALVALYKIGFPAEQIVNAGGFIMESTLLQVESDVSEIIKEYDRDTVASLGVIDGKIFYNQVDDVGKDFWLKEAGSLKRYCEAIPTVNSENDLSGPFFGGFESKELLGICDYDAISFVMHNMEYSLITIEAMIYSMSMNDEVKLKVTSIPDWFVNLNIDASKLISYIKKLLSLGCLMSITKEVIELLSEIIKKSDEATKNKIYSDWDNMLSSIDNFPEKYRIVAIQAISEVFGLFGDRAMDIDKELTHILVKNMLMLRKQKIEMFIDESGQLLVSLVDISPDDQIAEIKDQK